jgi:hypothetical protein
MRQVILRLFCIVCIVVLHNSIKAQNAETPVAYMSHISNTERELSIKYLSYMSASSHGKSMKKIEKRRADLINSIYEVRVKVNDMPSFNGDKSLRDSAVGYLKMMYSVFNEDYSKIVNMEEIAEQSYDLMEAYLMAQEKAGERLREAAAAYEASHKEFASRHNVKLIDSESDLDRKLEMAGLVNAYYNKVYLIFFKSHKQEVYMLEALKAKNTNAIEQNRNALIKNCTEGIQQVKEMKGFNSDRSLETVCRQVLEFYKDEAEKKMPRISEFILKEENFEKVKKAFETSEKTKKDVDNYNKAVADINKELNTYNATNQQLFEKRSDVVHSYEAGVKSFMDTHMPYAK